MSINGLLWRLKMQLLFTFLHCTLFLWLSIYNRLLDHISVKQPRSCPAKSFQTVYCDSEILAYLTTAPFVIFGAHSR